MDRKNLLGQSATRFLSACLLSLLVCSAAMAQIGSSVVNGTVTDAQGQVISGSTVTLRNEGQNLSRQATSDSAGNFVFTVVPPGSYSLEVEAKGFKKSQLTELRALVDKSVTVEIKLEVGTVTELVTVSASTSENIINTQDASLGNNFVSKQILQLPLNARNVGDLLSLQPAVTPTGYVAGGRRDQANLTIDGLDANDQQDGSTFNPIIRVNPDSIEEFRVTTVNANATQGRSSGAQVSFITRSGTNKFSGALYEFHRNTVTTANDFFNNRSGVPRPNLIRNVFGGRLGGPIVKDKLFFFYNYEGLREAKKFTQVRTVPLASLGRGEVKFNANVWEGGKLGPKAITLTPAQINALTTTGVPGGTPLVDTNPVGLGVLAAAAAKYPSNDTTIGDGVNTSGYRFNAASPVNFNAHTVRFDWNATDNHKLFVRGNYQHDTLVSTTRLQQFPDTPNPGTWSHPLALGVGHIWTLSPSVVNNFRFGLTRDAFSNQGDSSVNAVTFRSVYSDAAYLRTFNRTTPVYNFTDDITGVKGKHNWQLGTNIRIIRNRRENFASVYDNGITNQSFYAGAGNVLTNPVNAYLRATFPKPNATDADSAISSDFVINARTGLAAVFGRLSQYGANFNFGLDGNPLPSGVGVFRELATEEYDVYGQDVWKVSPNLTLTLGLRYGLSRPVYETQGYQAKPNVGLEDYLNNRILAANKGQNYDVPLQVILAGPANDAPGYYPFDKNNFQPRIAFAYQPRYSDGFWSKVFGKDGATVLRGGFAVTNDYFGQALAVNFDTNNTLGFSSNQTISANTYNVTTNPAPLFTGIGQDIKSLPRITTPGRLTFPQQKPQNQARRIEGSLDGNLVSPINYTFNFTVSRNLPAGFVVEASYVARLARNLLAARDVMALNNILDPATGQSWYQAAGIIEDLRLKNTPISQIPRIPFFENLYGAGRVAVAVDDYLGTDYADQRLNNSQAAYAAIAEIFGSDYTSLQDALDFERPLFFNSQYGALAAYGTFAGSDYHGATVSVRQRLSSLTWDFNYSFSKSLDDVSGLQTSGVFGAAFVTNPLRPKDNRSVSDFDIRHVINFNSVWELPIGRGHKFLGNANKFVDAILGGWQFSTIMRYNSGLPINAPFDANGWATNWNVRSIGVRIKDVESSPTRGSGSSAPNLFKDPKAAYQSFRSPRAGETGDRNLLRYPGYFVLDMGLAKSFKMPFNENHSLQFRWETFNVTNTQSFTGLDSFSIGLDPQLGSPAPRFGNFTGIQGSPRVMQFGLRYDF